MYRNSVFCIYFDTSQYRSKCTIIIQSGERFIFIVRGAERREPRPAGRDKLPAVIFIVRGVIAENSRTSSSYCSRCTHRELPDVDTETDAGVLTAFEQ